MRTKENEPIDILTRHENPILAACGEHLATQYTKSVIRKKSLPPVHQMVQELHRRLLGPLVLPENRDIYTGSYRTRDVLVVGTGLTPPIGLEVEKAMDHFVLNTQKSIDELKQDASINPFTRAIAEIHYNLTRIHPWTDGNGRVARHFIRILSLLHGHRPIVMGPIHRKRYLDSLDKTTQTNNIAYFTLFLAKTMKEQYSEEDPTCKTCRQDLDQVVWELTYESQQTTKTSSVSPEPNHSTKGL